MDRIAALHSVSPLLALLAPAVLAITFPLGCSPPPPHPVAPTIERAIVSEPTNDDPADAGGPRPAPKSHRFAVATESPAATKIAVAILEEGGSAADAAIAAAFASGVVHPVSSGLGGGGFALLYDAKKREVLALDFRSAAPIGLRPNDHVVPPKEKKRGILVGVPGEVAGLAAIHERLGKLSFAEDLRASAELAEKGFPVSAHLARTLKFNEAWVRATPRWSRFLVQGALASVNDTLQNPALAATLRRLAAEGPRAFYEGDLAKDVIQTARDAGSRLIPRDLSSYKAEWRTPLSIAWEGLDVFTMPPPSGGGLLVIETLAMHKKSELAALGYGTGAYDHLLAETFRGALADRIRYLGDPGFVKRDLAELASVDRMRARRAKISMDSTSPPERFSILDAGTSHVVVVDAEGNVASITSTVNGMFGSRLVTAGGFPLNDELDDFTLPPVEKRFAVPPRGPNAARGGARPVSSMTPTLVLRRGEPVLALGGSGGARVPSAVAQTLLAFLVFDRSVASAVADPRIDTPSKGGLQLDPSVSAEVRKDLADRGEVLDTTTSNFSAVQAISVGVKDGARVLEAVADPRKSGDAFVE